jgi:hypothetical protein
MVSERVTEARATVPGDATGNRGEGPTGVGYVREDAVCFAG